MAKEYIDRERLKEAFSTDTIHSLQYHDESLFELILLEIDEIPAADVAPVVHSKWICTDYDEAEWLCMNCKESLCLADAMVDPIEDAKLYYCPNCGAKMDGGNDRHA